MKEQGREKMPKIPVSILLALFLLALVLLTVQMLSRYVNGGNGDGNARVAKFQVTSDLTKFQETFSVKLKPGESKEYSFEIENKSETAVELLMKLEYGGNLPLQISYKDSTMTENEQKKIVAENILTEPNSEWRDHFNVGDRTKSYTLTISWPEDRNDMTYAGGVSTVELKIKAEQTD